MITEWTLVGVVVFLFGLEMWALRQPDDDVKLITTVIRGWSKRFGILPFAAGVLAGHFWFC